MTYPCGHSVGWYVVSTDSEPRCMICHAPVPNPPGRSDAAMRLLSDDRPQLRLIEGGGEGESGATSA